VLAEHVGTATDEVVAFVVGTRPGDVPGPVLELGRKSILDGLGLAVAGSRSEAVRLVRAVAAGGPGAVALALGVAIHVDDFDDIQLAGSPGRVYGLLMHPTAPVLAAVLALGERDRRSGADVSCAYHVGVEVACTLAEAISPRHYADGFHTTGTCGAIGAAAAASNLAGLPPDETRHALGIAASQAAGLRASFGTMTKALHAGRAAQSGLLAVALARAGFTAAERVLEAPQGFFHAAGGGFDETLLRGRLGNPWTFLEPGIALKPYPCASLAHPGIELALAVRAHGVPPEAIRSVRVGTKASMPTALRYPRPRSALEAKFSMEYCVAVALVDGVVGLAQFEEAAVGREEVAALMERVTFEVDPRAEAAGPGRMATFLTVELADGAVLESREDFPRGTPARPLAYADLARKFAGCAAYGGLEPSRADEVVGLVDQLESLAEIGELTALLRTGEIGRASCRERV